MVQRALGGSDLAITPVGVGTAPIGSSPGVWWVNWGAQDEGEAVRAIQAALDAGVNWIDTAPFYGWGRAEEIVGRAIRGCDAVLVFTKCGTMRRDDGGDYMDLRPPLRSARARTRSHCTARQPANGSAGAVAFVLSHPAVTGAIVGVRNEREAAEIAHGA
jgi:aryl-alcohol dehydrogenase-like predicted oxidoreductase